MTDKYLDLDVTSEGRLTALDPAESHVDEFGDTITTRYFHGPTVITTNGSGLWGCEPGREVNVTGITVEKTEHPDGSAYYYYIVHHDSTWNIYTDRAFEHAISNLVGLNIGFTEQGMQDDELASMEPDDNDEPFVPYDLNEPFDYEAHMKEQADQDAFIEKLRAEMLASKV